MDKKLPIITKPELTATPCSCQMSASLEPPSSMCLQTSLSKQHVVYKVSCSWCRAEFAAGTCPSSMALNITNVRSGCVYGHICPAPRMSTTLKPSYWIVYPPTCKVTCSQSKNKGGAQCPMWRHARNTATWTGCTMMTCEQQEALYQCNPARCVIEQATNPYFRMHTVISASIDNILLLSEG